MIPPVYFSILTSFNSMFNRSILFIITVHLAFLFNIAIGQDCLTAHNYLRSLHGVGPLKYDETLERFAMKRAEYMAQTDIFAHPKKLKYGENLYWRSGNVPTCENAVLAWYNEISLYNYDFPRFSPKTGHFSQLVWRESKKIGCAAAESPKSGRIYIACNYYPPGNVRGRFEENVLYPDYVQDINQKKKRKK
ncbi:Golgi-associated plant pathogenesis-related protein 1-like [Brevipalpus obovatus]|uniref:Golgi-associated plant pathogenesis-related protein 1-like n=1 Tax=Brevipalpus obovatus TaxID=246614 RepID=UPI003D9E0D4F